MNEYYFLFAVALLWTIFATVQDIRKREVSNWLNFSFIAIALAYRAFFAVSEKNLFFFLSGLIGFAVFFALAHAFYYSKTFAGGDAKLLMAFGAILPYKSYSDIFLSGIVFIFLLFLVGAIYSLLYSTLIIYQNNKKFVTELRLLYKKTKYFLLISIFLSLISFSLASKNIFFVIPGIFLLIPAVYVYTKAIDKCMSVILPASKLTEGDWIEKDIKVGKYVVKKTVHGLSAQDIKLLKKYNKKVLVKQGVPFVPAFLISLIVMVFFFLVLKLHLSDLVSFLF